MRGLAAGIGIGIAAVALLVFLARCGGSEPPTEIPDDKGPDAKDGSAARSPSPWPTYHGHFSLTGVADTPPPDAPVRLWRFKAGEYIEHTPVSSEGRVYFTTDKGWIYAIGLDGKEAWKKKIEKDSFSAPPMVTDGLVVVGTENGILYAYETATGAEKWKYTVGDMIQGSANRVDLPEGKKGIVALSQADGSIHCVALESGRKLWQTEPIERCDGSASVGNGKIIMGSCASALHVFSVEDPRKSADIDLGGDSQVAGGVALSDHVAFAGTRTGSVCAVDVRAGEILWTNSDSKRETFTTPAVNGESVVFGSDDGKVYRLNRDTGKKIWEFDTEDSPSSPVIAGDRVVVSSGGAVYLLDLKTGKKIWSAEVSDEITSPAVVGGMVIVGAGDGTVTAFGKK